MNKIMIIIGIILAMPLVSAESEEFEVTDVVTENNKKIDVYIIVNSDFNVKNHQIDEA